MKQSKAEVLKECFTLLVSEYGDKLTEQQKAGKKELFKKIIGVYPIDKIKEMTMRMIKNRVYANFPKIAEMVEIIEGNPEVEAETAWLELKEKIFKEGGYQSVTFKNPVIMSVVEDALGGWVKVCDTLSENMKWLKIDFMRYYPIMKERGDHPKELTGIFEIENNRMGYNNDIVKRLEEPEKIGDIIKEMKIKKEVN
jgi:hypothetical protein